MDFEVIQDIGYGFIPRKIMRDKALSIQAKAIYSYLASFAGNTGKSFPTTKLMASELGISSDTLFKYLKELKDKGVIRVEKEKTETSRFAKNVYYLNNEINKIKSPYPNSSDTEISDMELPYPKSSDTKSSDTRISDTNNNNLNNNNINNNNKKNSALKNAHHDFFEELWNRYPNKRNKGQISNAKKKELYKLGDEIFRSIERYISDVEERRANGFTELKYKAGSTFFNSGYIDYLDDNYLQMKREVKTDEYTTRDNRKGKESNGSDIGEKLKKRGYIPTEQSVNF